MSSPLITTQQRIQPLKRRLGEMATTLTTHITGDPETPVKKAYIGDMAQIIADTLEVLNLHEKDYDVEYLHKEIATLRTEKVTLESDLTDTKKDLEEAESLAGSVEELEYVLREISDNADHVLRQLDNTRRY